MHLRSGERMHLRGNARVFEANFKPIFWVERESMACKMEMFGCLEIYIGLVTSSKIKYASFRILLVEDTTFPSPGMGSVPTLRCEWLRGKKNSLDGTCHIFSFRDVGMVWFLVVSSSLQPKVSVYTRFSTPDSSSLLFLANTTYPCHFTSPPSSPILSRRPPITATARACRSTLDSKSFVASAYR